jgi:cbb3-type cytochrome oxidase subunit 3
MTFVRFWIGFTMVGISTAILLLMWALRRRQFKESDRAAYLALADVGEADAPAPVASRDTKVLAAILGIGIAGLVAVAVMSAFVGEGGAD